MMNNTKSTFILAILMMAAASVCAATGPDFFDPFSSSSDQKRKTHQNQVGGDDGFYGPDDFDIPGFEKGWGNGIMGGGYGGGFGGPSGSFSKGGIVRPSVVCKEKGPCYNKKLTCPAKCFTSFSRSGKGYGVGGGGGGCSMDCKEKCVAYC
ncbi:hypothetical protein J1N35_034197 [Gossypium stocksii]|uniref:Glycine-rich protein n=1 Tax=Gossypium stocksii TaxID=47602 RepID=A0A9D3URL7_9ROSI|nr:hypothetical protein J1N35_034197 [Gossypium stocksii]